jgi:hypothetical protein
MEQGDELEVDIYPSVGFDGRSELGAKLDGGLADFIC